MGKMPPKQLEKLMNGITINLAKNRCAVLGCRRRVQRVHVQYIRSCFCKTHREQFKTPKKNYPGFWKVTK